MAKVVIDPWGTKRYYNDRKQLHRDDGPAIIYPNGDKFWLESGTGHGTKHPSDIRSNGRVIWRNNDFWGRNNGPSWDYPNGHKQWQRESKIIWPKL